MITLPKFDLEKMVNDVVGVSDSAKEVEIKLTIKVKGTTPSLSFAAATGMTTTQWVGGSSPDDLMNSIKMHAQQIYLQFSTATAKLNGKRARDRVKLAAALFKEIVPDGELSAFKDGDFVFCRLVQKEEADKLKEALQKHGWVFGKKQPEHDGHGGEIKGTGGEHWTQKPGGRDMKLPENQDRVSFSVKIGPVPSMWKILNQNGRDVFEFWFDEFST